METKLNEIYELARDLAYNNTLFDPSTLLYRIEELLQEIEDELND